MAMDVGFGRGHIERLKSSVGVGFVDCLSHVFVVQRRRLGLINAIEDAMSRRVATRAAPPPAWTAASCSGVNGTWKVACI